VAARKKKRGLRPRLPSRVKRRKSAKPARARPHGHHSELWGLGLVALGLFLAVVLYGSWNGGIVGGPAADAVHGFVGAAAYLMPLALVVVGGLMVARSELVDFRPFRVGLGVFVFGVLTLLGSAHGGFLGDVFGGGLDKLLGPGATIVGALALIIGALLLTGASAGALVRRSHSAVRAAAKRRPRPVAAATPRPKPKTTAATKPPLDAVAAYPDVVGATEPPLLVQPREQDQILDGTLSEDPPSLFDVKDLSVSEHADYELPDRTLLNKSQPNTKADPAAADRIGEALVQTLEHFGIDANLVGRIAGPRVTRYELQLAPGTKVSKVAALKDDLSYALATTEIRILAPIPGKQAVGVEVPNLSPNLVTLGDIYADLPQTASPLSVWLGKDISGNAVWTDLARMPHILIAGTTGSGKSGCINTILTSILLRATPDEVRMILVDPKRIELGYYESIPHLLTPVVSNPKQAAAALANVVAEMERRYEKMSILRSRSLGETNRQLRARGEPTMPYLLVVIDELADLMMMSPQDVEESIIRLAQKSRAVGIHLVLATQRPSVDVITGMIKANVPSRIAFAVSSQTDSRVIIDANGAESLLGQGDMLFKPLGTSRLQRVQGAYVSEDEVSLIVEQARAQRPQELDESLLVAPDVEVFEEDVDNGEFDPDEDPLLDRAIEVVVQTQTASVSLLQRRLRVGYTRAGRLIDMLERRGIISGYEGSKPRRVLLDERAIAQIGDQV
jgi:S-DNA-T family DNA segregation ATPase FtsK/SpoIIIE